MSLWEICSYIYFSGMLIGALILYIVAFIGGFLDLRKMFKNLESTKKQNCHERTKTECSANNE